MDQPSAYVIPQELLDRLDGICIGLQDVLLEIFSNYGVPDFDRDENGLESEIF